MGLLSILPKKAVVVMLLAFRLGLYPKSIESISISMAQTSIFYRLGSVARFGENTFCIFTKLGRFDS